MSLKTGKALMRSSLTEKNPALKNDIILSTSNILGNSIHSATRIGKGQNSRVYIVEDTKSVRYILKLYPISISKRQNRLTTEYEALTFLSENNITCVPKPLGLDKTLNLAIYQYIDGSPLISSEISNREIDEAINFVMELNRLSKHHLAVPNNIKNASEACFSTSEIIDTINQRLNRLKKIPLETVLYENLQGWLSQHFEPAFKIIQSWCELNLKKIQMSLDTQVEYSHRTLSSSDFGFHNALRKEDGSIVFLDFEYFGWDTPSKILSDFLLHPAMSLKTIHKTRFRKGILEGFNDYSELSSLAKIVYPLWGLKWCTIILNEFDPELVKIREFANTANKDMGVVQINQLNKANLMLKKVTNEYRNFPYA